MKLPRSEFPRSESPILVFLLSLLLLMACEGSPTIPGDEDLPLAFRVTGFAEGQMGDRSITCQLDMVFERDRRGVTDSGGKSVFPAEFGGFAGRTVLWPNGSGVSLWPDLHCPDCQVRLWAGDSIQLFSPRDSASETPFYVGIGHLTGKLKGSSEGGGSWTCAPFKVRGDDLGEVEGSWVFEPIG